MWSVLNFGKHNGKSLPEIILHDPDWFFWSIEKDVFAKGGLVAEARELDFKARNIKIPRPRSEHWRVKYNFHRGSFIGFELVQVSSAAEASPTRLDLSVPYRQKHYDKYGSRLLLRDFKKHYFGDPKTRLTRKKCWEFFDNVANFYEPPKPECREPRWSDLLRIMHEVETRR
jgi:hypothetical protein